MTSAAFVNRIFMSITTTCSLLLHNFQLPFGHEFWLEFSVISFADSFFCLSVFVVYYGPCFMLFMLAACV